MNAEKPSRDSGTLWIVVPFALAVVGTVVMLFTNSANVLKVSLVLALWAAAAGILLAARLRRDRDTAERELVAREERYEAQLDAVHARGEADRAARALERNAGGAPTGVDVEVLREIQAELARLRAQLEELSGRQFEYEPAALRAEARRIAELERAGGSTKREEPAEPAVPAAEPVEAAQAAAAAPAEKPTSGPSTDETAKIKRVTDEAPVKKAEPVVKPEPGLSRPVGAPSFDAIAGRFGTQRDTLTNAQNPLSQLISERQAEHVEPVTPEPEPKPEPKPAPAPKQDEDVRGGRRRRDEHGRGSLTVAELLARSKRDNDNKDAE
ncbi:DUF6779 domain-containing protein [Corynebacterium qintianiae]|nr:DUF6779 domain-containing protein [Corynebacterium qintianiae]